ncbi:MAG: RagB/SusD family nutrient uptake outer membrane protein [Odoribacter sp.]
MKNDFSWRGSWYIFETEFLNEYFDVSVDGSNDIRYREGTGFIHDASGQFVQKYNQEGLWTSLENTVPLIRLPEMYYILAECAEDEGEAAGYLNKVREARGIEAVAFEMNPEEALTKEYRKEFYAEGQLFFFYKRWFKSSFLHCPVREMKANNYQFSIPDDEILFGDVPQ